MKEIMTAGTRQDVCVRDKVKMSLDDYEEYDPKTTGQMSLGASSSIIVDIKMCHAYSCDVHYSSSRQSVCTGTLFSDSEKRKAVFTLVRTE